MSFTKRLSVVDVIAYESWRLGMRIDGCGDAVSGEQQAA